MRKPGSNGSETLRNLRSAAIRLLSERGYQGMNLRTLASDLGMQAGSLYNYIESKQELLFWLMKDATEKLLKGFEAEVEPIEDPQGQLCKFIAFHLEYHIANRKESAVLATEMRSLTPRNYRSIAELQRLYTDKVHDIVRRGCAGGKFRCEDSQIAAFALVQMVTGITRWYQPRGRVSVAGLIDIYTGLTLGMLGAGAGVANTRAARSNGKTSIKAVPGAAISAA